MLINRAVRRGEVALIAAGGDGKHVLQRQHGGVIVRILRITDGHAPRAAVALLSADIDVPAERGRARHTLLAEDLRHAVGRIALGDAAEIHGAARVERDAVSVDADVLRPDERQKRGDLLLRGNARSVARDAPRRDERGDRDIKRAAGLIAQCQRALQQLHRLVRELRRAGLVQRADFAARARARKALLKGVDLLTGRGQRGLRVFAVDGEVHHRVHREDLACHGLLLRAAGGERERRQRRQQQ